MNGWTPSITLETRVNNLFAQIPQEHHMRAALVCYGEDDNEFERKLTGYVISREWEKHPADIAADIEATPLAEQVAAEVQRDNQWLDSIISRNDWDFTPLQNMPIIDMDKIDEIPL